MKGKTHSHRSTKREDLLPSEQNVTTEGAPPDGLFLGMRITCNRDGTIDTQTICMEVKDGLIRDPETRSAIIASLASSGLSDATVARQNALLSSRYKSESHDEEL